MSISAENEAISANDFVQLCSDRSIDVSASKKQFQAITTHSPVDSML